MVEDLIDSLLEYKSAMLYKSFSCRQIRFRFQAIPASELEKKPM